MPINTDSEEWKNADVFDPIRTEIDNLLSQDTAYSVKEIEEYIVHNSEHVFPADLVGDEAVEGAKAARQSIIASILSRMYWRYAVEFRHYSGDDEIDSGLYFKSDGAGINPIVELEMAVGYDSEEAALSSSLETRFDEVEDDIDEEVSELTDRIDFLEHRIREELGAY